MNLETLLREHEIYSPELLQLLTDKKQSLTVPSKTAAEIFSLRDHHFTAIHGKKNPTEHDILVAKELCLVILTNFRSCFWKSQHTNDSYEMEGYKILYSKTLQEQVRLSRSHAPYAAIIKLLMKKNFIERGRNHTTGGFRGNAPRSREYRLKKRFYKKGFQDYQIQTEEVLNLRGRRFNQALERALKTSIGKMSLRLRSQVNFLPSEDVLQHLKDVAKKGYTNKNGKKLVNRGKKAYDPEKYVFVEDYLELYETMRDAMTIPFVSEELGIDGRIADFYNMMPKIVREILPVQGQKMHEIDFNTLHPNIIQRIYNPNPTRPITHDAVVESLYGLKRGDEGFTEKRKEVKKAHLSYFNMKWEHMTNSPVHKYYMEHHPQMMEAINRDKADETHGMGYKITAYRLFKEETNLMEDIISKLWKKGVLVGYVYDALYCLEMNKQTVLDVMNDVAEQREIWTTAEGK